jgi:hypothetical protein
VILVRLCEVVQVCEVICGLGGQVRFVGSGLVREVG